MQNNEPFEIRSITYRYNGGGLGNAYDVVIYYFHRMHSVHYQMMGKDEADVMARIYRQRGEATTFEVSRSQNP